MMSVHEPDCYVSLVFSMVYGPFLRMEWEGYFCEFVHFQNFAFFLVALIFISSFSILLTKSSIIPR